MTNAPAAKGALFRPFPGRRWRGEPVKPRPMGRNKRRKLRPKAVKSPPQPEVTDPRVPGQPEIGNAGANQGVKPIAQKLHRTSVRSTHRLSGLSALDHFMIS